MTANIEGHFRPLNTSESCSQLGTTAATVPAIVKGMINEHVLKIREDRFPESFSTVTAAVQQFKPEDYMKSSISLQRVSIDGMRPLALTKKQIIAVLGSAKLVDRMLWATRHANGRWLTIIREGRDLLIATESVETAYVRLIGGEHPPLMPSERKQTVFR